MVKRMVVKRAAGELATASATVAGNQARTASSAVGNAATNAGAMLKSIFGSAGEAFAGVFGFMAPTMGPAAGPAAAEAPWTPDGARNEAKRLLGEAVRGIDRACHLARLFGA